MRHRSKSQLASKKRKESKSAILASLSSGHPCNESAWWVVVKWGVSLSSQTISWGNHYLSKRPRNKLTSNPFHPCNPCGRKSQSKLWLKTKKTKFWVSKREASLFSSLDFTQRKSRARCKGMPLFCLLTLIELRPWVKEIFKSNKDSAR